jgi:hypothetical protein
MQNDIVVGLLLLMFAIVPNHATRPPRDWFRDPSATGYKGVTATGSATTAAVDRRTSGMRISSRG